MSNTHLSDKVLDDFGPVEHSCTVEGGHLLYITRTETYRLLGWLEAEHELDDFEGPLGAGEVHWSRQVVLLGGDLGA